MSIKIPYMRKKASTLLTLSAIALLLSSPMLFFNVLQPVQAQTLMTFKTLGPARGTDPATRIDFNLTFDAYGTTNSPNPQSVKITGGTVQLQQDPENNGRIYNGTAFDGAYTNDSKLGPNFYFSTTLGQTGYSISSACSTSDLNNIDLTIEDLTVQAGGGVECSTGGGGNTASSSSMTGPTQDSDGDGMPDSSDRCASNSNQRCFKEGDDTSNSTTQQQPSSSSSNGTGNQTKG
jgi:hypothetical protein